MFYPPLVALLFVFLLLLFEGRELDGRDPQNLPTPPSDLDVAGTTACLPQHPHTLPRSCSGHAVRRYVAMQPGVAGGDAAWSWLGFPGRMGRLLGGRGGGGTGAKGCCCHGNRFTIVALTLASYSCAVVEPKGERRGRGRGGGGGLWGRGGGG
jgi:hypothetical protein